MRPLLPFETFAKDFLHLYFQMSLKEKEGGNGLL